MAKILLLDQARKTKVRDRHFQQDKIDPHTSPNQLLLMCQMASPATQ